MSKLLKKLGLIALLATQMQPAFSSDAMEKPYGRLQGGTLLVEGKDGQKRLVSLYEGCNDCDAYNFASYYFEAISQDQVNTIEVQDYDADIDLEIGSKYRQFPLSRASVPRIENASRQVVTSGDAEDVTMFSMLVTLPADLILSPFIWGANKIHRGVNVDDHCANDSLEFMRDPSRIGKAMSVSESCYEYILTHVRG